MMTYGNKTKNWKENSNHILVLIDVDFVFLVFHTIYLIYCVDSIQYIHFLQFTFYYITC